MPNLEAWYALVAKRKGTGVVVGLYGAWHSHRNATVAMNALLVAEADERFGCPVYPNIMGPLDDDAVRKLKQQFRGEKNAQSGSDKQAEPAGRVKAAVSSVSSVSTRGGESAPGRGKRPKQLERALKSGGVNKSPHGTKRGGAKRSTAK